MVSVLLLRTQTRVHGFGTSLPELPRGHFYIIPLIADLEN